MDTHTFWTCVDCYIALVNDDYTAMSPERAKEVRDALASAGDISPGLDASQHADNCQVTQDYLHGVYNNEPECECDTIAFSWSPCDTCLSPLGGSRHAVTYWPSA